MYTALHAGIPGSNPPRGKYFFLLIFTYIVDKPVYQVFIARYPRVLHFNLILPTHIYFDMAEACSTSLDYKDKHGNRYRKDGKCSNIINHVLEVNAIVYRIQNHDQ